MALMTDQKIRREAQARRNQFRMAAGLGALGVVMAATGFILWRTGDAESGGAGVVAGVGAGLVLVGAVSAWRKRLGNQRWRSEPIQTRRDRLQAQRTRLLWTFPVVGLALLFVARQTLSAAHDDFRAIDYLRLSLPVLYAWLVVLIVLGWDKQSLVNRRLLDDELTQAFRARALKAAFIVLMSGTTIALPLTVWRPDIGVMATIVALTAAGAAAGFRFAWLDRQASEADAGDE